MAHRGMNNTEKAAAAMLKKEGFHVFYQESHNGTKGDWYATHEKLICQYHVGTTTDQALEDLRKKKLQLVGYTMVPICPKCKGKGWYFVNEFIGHLQGRKDCECVTNVAK